LSQTVEERVEDAPPPEEKGERERGFDWRNIVLIPLLALLAGLVVGALVMVFTDPDTLRSWSSFTRNPGKAVSDSWTLVYEAYKALFKGSLGSPRAISETVVAATPLIFAGLSVALAFKAGLFNIGGEGQILIGAMTSAIVGFKFSGLPTVIHLPLAILAGFIGGGLWAFVPGFLKAKTGAHEVIVTIMMNYVAYRLVDYLLRTEFIRRPGRTDPISRSVAESARLPHLLGSDYRVHAGIILALFVTWGVWWLLFRSTIGFRFRAVGQNPHAASYAGMSVGGTFMLIMFISGGLSGLAGASQLLGVQYNVFPGFASGYGFDAIALALLGRTHPGGVLLAALLFGILRSGATGMQAATSIPVDIIVVIQALIIVFMAAPALVREIFRIQAKKQVEQDTMTASWGS
jgi:simple sugar transport system permease protein